MSENPEPRLTIGRGKEWSQKENGKFSKTDIETIWYLKGDGKMFFVPGT